MPEIRPVNADDEAEVRAWYDAMREAAVDGFESLAVRSYAALANALRDPSPHYRLAVFSAVVDGTVVGTLDLGFPLTENTDHAEWGLHVRPAYRGNGYGRALFEYGHRYATAEGRNVHGGEVNVPAGLSLEEYAGSRFALRNGFTSEHQEDRFILDLPLSAERLAEIRAHAAEKHAGYDFVTWTGACPDEYVEAYAAMRTAMSHDVPTGTLDYEPVIWDVERVRLSEQRLVKNGYASITTAARDAAGAFAGYSLMFVPAAEERMVYQDDTLVVSGHRGHRLGAALKARNLEVVQRDHPERTQAHTWTAGVNDAMRHVNAAFGYRSVDQMHEMQRTDPR